MAKVSKMHQKVIDKQNMKSGISNNNFWDEAEGHYVNCLSAINQVEGQLAQVLQQLTNDPTKLSYIENQAGLANNINILNKDVQEHVSRLESIHAKHAGKTGGTVTPDDHMLLLQIHGEYAESLDIYQANIVPTIAFILEQIGAAEALIIAQEEASKVAAVEEPVRDFTQDTAVVDVEFTEIKK